MSDKIQQISSFMSFALIFSVQLIEKLSLEALNVLESLFNEVFSF
ncbi:MAG: hypothetical protein WAK14_10290 [Methanobacterium sp.]